MKKDPLVSVLMNCYNGEKYLRQAIGSVLAQSHQNWEIIFWDNRSTDGSAAIVTSYADSRIKYYHAPQHTLLYEARNYAIAQASGEFLAFLDVDDWWVETKLERQLERFADPDVGLVCSNYWVESEQKQKRWPYFRRPMPEGWVLNDLLGFYYIGLLTLVVRRTALDTLGYPCDPRYHIIGDFDLVVRLCFRWKMSCLQGPLAFRRLHDANESHKHRKRFLDEMDAWTGEMLQLETIQACPNARSLRARNLYLRAMYEATHADRGRAVRLFRALPWSRDKMKLAAALFIPAFALRRLRS